LILGNQSRAPSTPDYWPVDPALLALLRSCRFDIFLRSSASTFVLYRERGTPLDLHNLERLKDTEVKALFIRFADRDAYEEALRTQILPDWRLSTIERQRVVKAVMLRDFENSYRANDVGAIVRSAGQLGCQLAEALKNRDFELPDLFDSMGHNAGTFGRATNVSIYCIVLADHLGIVGEAERSAIVAGGLLRDIGMRNLPGSLLNKPGSLSREERRTIESHAQRGFEELCSQPDLHWGQLMMAYQHHERLNASGYPVALADDEIHPWAKICAVADVFDALTGSRPYRKPFSSEAAIAHLQSRAGTHFDREAVACLTTLMCKR
jgi:HD-GYP domain-containing protein (c-di-GMP phosphodiesterase class II)